MQRIKCSYTPRKIVTNYALELKEPEAIVRNLISVYQTENNTLETPTIEQLKKLRKEKRQELKDLMIALPLYKENNALQDIMQVSNNEISLRLLNGSEAFALGLGKDPMTGLKLDESLRKILNKDTVNMNKNYLTYLLYKALVQSQLGEEGNAKEIEFEAINRLLEYLKYKLALLNAPKQLPTVKQKVVLNNKPLSLSYYPEKAINTYLKIMSYMQYAKEHITKDDNTHTYYIDGKPVDVSVTQYIERLYGNKSFNDPIDGYKFALEMGNAVDHVMRDYFIWKFSGSKLSKEEYFKAKTYKNLDNKRLEILLRQGDKLVDYFNNTYGERNYIVITLEIPFVSTFNDNNGKNQTIAGTADLILIDKDGHIHLYDFKAKTRELDATLSDGRITSDRRDYSLLLALYKLVMEDAIPSVLVDSTDLIWFMLSYPKQNSTNNNITTLYHTNSEGVVNVSFNNLDGTLKYVSLALYASWITPKLDENPSKSVKRLNTTQALSDLKDNNFQIVKSDKPSNNVNTFDIYNNIGITDVVYDSKSNALARYNPTTGKITLSKKSFTPEEVIVHLSGEGNKPYSDLKKRVLKELESKHGWNLDRIKQLITSNTDATSLILLHEMSHRQNLDTYDVKNYMSDEAIAIETRATLESLQKLEELKNTTYDEMLLIKNRAIANGTFMKAPNGKDTNLTEEQWLQVRTKAFKDWFGDWENDPANASKVIDENGEPLVVYHHTDNPNLTEFSADYENYFAKDGGTRKAIFFDEEKTGTLNRKYDVAVFLNIRELNEYNETKQLLHDRGTTYREVVNLSAEKNDIDGGVHMKDFDDNKKEHQSVWIVHNPNLINIIGSLQAPQPFYEGKVTPDANVVSTSVDNSITEIKAIPESSLLYLQVDKESKSAKLVRDFPNPLQRALRADNLARDFLTALDGALYTLIEELNEKISKEHLKNNPNLTTIAKLQQMILEVLDADKGRENTLKYYTINRIIKDVRAKWEELANMSETEAVLTYGEQYGIHIIDQARKVLDNFEILLNDASTVIESIGNIRITFKEDMFNNGNENVILVNGNVENTAYLDTIEDSEFDDDEEGRRANGSEGWGFEVRFVDPKETTTTKVKNVLGGLLLEGPNGFEYDDLGRPRYMDSNVVFAILLDKLSSMIDSDDFSTYTEDAEGNRTYKFTALEQLVPKYPWVNLIIELLNYDLSLASAFYTAFRMDFIPYWMLFYDVQEQKWKSHSISKTTILDSALSDVIRNYELGLKLSSLSIYNTGGIVDIANVLDSNLLLDDTKDLLEEEDSDNYDTISKNISELLKRIGFNVGEEEINKLINQEETDDFIPINEIWKIVGALSTIHTELLENGFGEKEHLIDKFKEQYNTIALIVGDITDIPAPSSQRMGKKTRPSYSAPNHVNTLFKNLKSEKRYKDYIDLNFKNVSWFYDEANDDWRVKNGWLAKLSDERNTELRRLVELREIPFIERKEYKDWTPNDIRTHFAMEYFSIPVNKGSAVQYGMFNFPIISDTEVALFVKFERETGLGWENRILNNLKDVVLLEMFRMSLIERRNIVGVSEITNFDKTGRKFRFFPEFEIVDDEGTSPRLRIFKAAESKNSKLLEGVIKAELSKLLRLKFETYYDSISADDALVLKDYLTSEGVISGTESIEEAMREYYYNLFYATSLIIQLTVTDLAFYKNSVDFQKRFKEICAAGHKLNTNSTYGRKVERTIYLSDDIITSSIFLDIKQVLEKAVKDGRILLFDVDNILDKFKNVNVTDALAYRSLDSYRAILDMMGVWTPNMLRSYQRFADGDWDMEDFNLVWQTIKPFMFSHVIKADGVGGTIKVGHLNKNSEFLLLSTFQMLASSLKKSSTLQAIEEFMQKNEIDVIQFESAVKAGKQGPINLNYSQSKLNKWFENAVSNGLNTSKKDFDTFKKINDNLLEEGSITLEEYSKRLNSIRPSKEDILEELDKYAKFLEKDLSDIENNVYGTKSNGETYKVGDFNPNVVHELSYEDYVIQLPNPEHLFDATSVFGSLFRNLVIADLPEDFLLTIKGKTYNKLLVLSLYQGAITENLLEDYRRVEKKFNTIEDLQEVLIRNIKANNKYSEDLINALEIVTIVDPIDSSKTRKVFNIPLNNPSTTQKLQELVFSIFKNNITKQHIKGGACVLVSDFGLTKELNIVFNKEGDRASGIKGVECYLPAYSKEFYEPFMEEKSFTGEDGKLHTYQELNIEKLPMSLREAIGFRIPTEAKYSMVPLIIKGFLPLLNGSCIMLPADITTIAGSDFDVDKLFIMLPEFRIQEYDIKAALRDYRNEASVGLLSDTELGEDIKFNDWLNKNSDKYLLDEPVVQKVEYNLDLALLPNGMSKLSRALRNNLIIDVARGILTHPNTAAEILNPGSFDKLKLSSRISDILDDSYLIQKLMEYTLSRDEMQLISNIMEIVDLGKLQYIEKFLEDFNVDRNALSIDTFIHFHILNMAGAALIGMYANNTTAHSKFLRTNLSINKLYTFDINGRPIKSLHDISNKELKSLISKICAEFSAASVDNGKDPVLASLMLNTKTANIAGTLARAGLTIEEIAELFRLPIIRDTIRTDGELKNLKHVINAYFDLFKSITNSNDIGKVDFTSSNFLQNSLASKVFENDENITKYPKDYAKFLEFLISVGLLFTEKIIPVADAMGRLTRNSRADSPNGAVNPSLAGAALLVESLKRLLDDTHKKNFPLTGMSGILDADVNPSMTDEQLRNKFNSTKLPMLQAFRTLGIDFAYLKASEYFAQSNPYGRKLLLEIFNAAPDELFEGKSGITVIENFFSDILRFALSNTRLFGNEIINGEEVTFDDKRLYYLYEYPAKFLDIIRQNKNIANMGAIKRLSVYNGDIVMERSGRRSKVERLLIMRMFDDLLYSEETYKLKDEAGNEKEYPVLNLAIDLFRYSYYKDGLTFGPNSFGNMFSTLYLTSFPEFILTLREMLFTLREDSTWEKLLDLFYANHANDSYILKRISPTTITDANGNEISVITRISDNIIDVHQSVVRNFHDRVMLDNYTEGFRSLSRILVKEEDGSFALYKLVGAGTENNITYAKLPTFDAGEIRYNAKSTAVEMAGVKVSEELKRKKENLSSVTDNSKKMDALMEFAESYGQFDYLNDKNAQQFINSLDEWESLTSTTDTLDSPINILNYNEFVSAIEGLENENSYDGISKIADETNENICKGL